MPKLTRRHTLLLTSGLVAAAGLSATITVNRNRYRGKGKVIQERTDGRIIVADIEDQLGQRISVAQPLDGEGQQALVWSSAPLPCVMAMGQSQLTQAGRDRAIEATSGPRYPFHSVTFSTSSVTTAGNLVFDIYEPLQEKTLTDFGPVRNRNADHPGLLLQAVADATTDIQTAQGDANTGIFVIANARGAMPVTRFLKEPRTDQRFGVPHAYANNLTSMRAVKQIAGRYGREVDFTVLWVQGEAGSGTQAQWRGYFDKVVSDLQTDAMREIGQFPTWAVVQTASETGGGDPNAETAQAQYEAARDARCTEIYIAAPGYIGGASDRVHYTSLGRIMIGESIALAQILHKRRGRFYGCWPRTVQRRGASITIDFESDGSDVLFDNTWVSLIENFGFSYTGAAITAIAKTGPLQITITIAHAVRGEFQYAYTALDLTENGWPAARGQIYVSSGIKSPASQRGLRLPDDIRFYCPRFSVSLD